MGRARTRLIGIARVVDLSHMDNGRSRFDNIVDVVPVLIAVVDLDTQRLIDINQYGLDLLGYEREQVVDRDYRRIVHEIDQRPDQITESASDTTMIERRLRCADGTFLKFTMSIRPFPDEQGLVIVAGRPVRDLAQADSSLADLLALAELTDDMFLVCDKQGYVRYANRSARELHQTAEGVGEHLTEFLHESDTGYVKLLEAYRNPDHKASARTTAISADGSPITLSVQTVYDPMTERWFTVERDVRKLVAQERRLEMLTADLARRASTDALTGVANRSELNRLIGQALDASTPFGLLMMDMDDFKSVNDTLGHAAGDELLQAVAQRLESIARGNGTVGRLGGDEFVLLLPGVGHETAALIAARIVASIANPFSLNGVTISRSCSIGVALSEPGDDASAVLLRADQAAYQAKHAGRSRFRIHEGQGESWPTSQSRVAGAAI